MLKDESYYWFKLKTNKFRISLLVTFFQLHLDFGQILLRS